MKKLKTTATVAMLLITTAMLLPVLNVNAEETLIWTGNVSSSGATTNGPVLENNWIYRVEASEIWFYNYTLPYPEADAMYYDPSGAVWNWINPLPCPNGHSFLQINEQDVNWGPFSNGDTGHTYSIEIQGTEEAVRFRIVDWIDGDYTNNYCHLPVRIYRVRQVMKQFTAVTELCGGDAELVDQTHAAVYGLKSGPKVYFTVQYYFENSLNYLGDDYDGQTHNFVLWDKWGGNLMALGSPPTSFASPTLTLADGSSFSIDPRATDENSYRGYIGTGLDISNLASQGTAMITMHLGDQQEGTNPGGGKGTSKDSTSYDTDVTWFIGELAPGESATLTLYVAPGMNPGRQLEFTSLGCYVINTGPRVRVYGATFDNEDFLYAVDRTNTLTVCVYPKR